MDFIFWKVTFGDCIALISLVVTIWIAIIVQGNFTQSRYIREHFIKEITQIRDDYRRLFAQLYTNQLSAKDIKNRLKILSIRLQSIEAFIEAYYQIDGEKIYNIHSEFQKFLTSEDEFNCQFSNEYIIFSNQTQTKIQKHQGNITHAITKRIIDINSSKEKNRFRRKKSISELTSLKID